MSEYIVPAEHIEIGHRIRETREKQGYSVTEFAEMMGVHKSTLSMMETGKRRISLSAGLRAARLLGMSAREFVPLDVKDDPDEIELLTIYEEASSKDKSYLLNMARQHRAYVASQRKGEKAEE